MRNLDMEKFKKMTDIQIVKATVTILDRRTGKMENHEFFRAANAFPFDLISRELEKYGYDVIGYKDEDYTVGVLDWENLYNGFEAVKKVTA